MRACVCSGSCAYEKRRNDVVAAGDGKEENNGAKKSSGAGNHSSPGVKLSFGKINPPRYAGEWQWKMKYYNFTTQQRRQCGGTNRIKPPAAATTVDTRNKNEKVKRNNIRKKKNKKINAELRIFTYYTKGGKRKTPKPVCGEERGSREKFKWEDPDDDVEVDSRILERRARRHVTALSSNLLCRRAMI